MSDEVSSMYFGPSNVRQSLSLSAIHDVENTNLGSKQQSSSKDELAALTDIKIQIQNK